jgi:hypothetical protein
VRRLALTLDVAELAESFVLGVFIESLGDFRYAASSTSRLVATAAFVRDDRLVHLAGLPFAVAAIGQ